MTAEEAIKWLEYSKDHYEGLDYGAPRIALDMAISALREQEGKDANVPTKWISVEERLPEESGRYIVLRKSGDCLDCCYEKERDSWGVLIDMGEAGALWVAYKGVTHWMPLPEPPEVEV